MPIQTDFEFHQVTREVALAAAAGGPQPDRLGLLAAFLGGNDAKSSWKGTGFNMIWRPNFGGASGNNDFFLQLNLTTETLDFTNITGSGIANRGFLQKDILLGGIAYVQAINDSFDDSGQHFEPGVWGNVPQTDDPKEEATVVRMGSIPHGTTINLQGRAFTVPQPLFETASITPFRIGDPNAPVHFDEEDLSKPSTSRTDLKRVKSLTQAQLTNPNLFLSQALDGLTFVKTTVLQVASNTSAQTVPDAGGGTDNIAFLQGRSGGQPNADAPDVTATFWVEEVKDKQGKQRTLLQYTQRVLLNFNTLSWPHITVGTLELQP